jgi:uncharacterized Zn-binding protein involved in type VI secretion
MPSAARVGDMTTCSMQTPTPGGPVPHVGGPLAPLGPPPTVLIGGQPAATGGGCQCLCSGPAGPLPNPYTKGSATVLIGGKPALRMSDQGSHPGSLISKGCDTVQIGG